MARTNRTASVSSRAAWVLLLSTVVLLLVSLKGSDAAASSCPNCDIADSLLKPCKSSLQMNTWPGTLVYQPTQDQAACGCNQNYYDQIVACLKCQSSSSAHYSVKALADYQLVCLSYGQNWQQIIIPGTTTTTTTTIATTATTTTATTATTTSSSSAGSDTPISVSTPPGDLNSGSSNAVNGLSSGAIAGIVVSVIALIVALSVAGYVWGRRRRDSVRGGGDMDDYKYRGTPDSYMEVALPQYTGMIQPAIPSLAKVSNLRVTNPDSDDDNVSNFGGRRNQQDPPSSFEVQRNSSPGWRRGSFDDD